MRAATPLLAALATPLPLLAQYPEPGKYTAGAIAAGSSRVIPLSAVIEKHRDSLGRAP